MNVNELPQYKCHKIVRAAKITGVEPGGLAVIVDMGKVSASIEVPEGWVAKHDPLQGDGYVVAYDDGYLSWSPAAAFEAGYHRIPELGIACGSTADAAPANTGFLWRKKPVVIEARQFNGGWTGDAAEILDWMVKGGEWNGDTKELSIHTLEGVMTASKGDWIIKGVSGEFYPCKPDIFAATYEPADAPIIDLNAADFSDALMWLKEGRRVARALDPKQAISLAVGHAEKLAYDYAHVLPEGEERELALQVYHRIRLVFSNGKSGMGGHATNLIGATGGPEAVPDIDLNAADFSDALMWLKEGKRVQRAGWNGKGQYVILIPGDHLARSAGYGFGEVIGEFTFGSVLALKNAQNIMQPGWVPSMGDLMAEDWQVVSD